MNRFGTMRRRLLRSLAAAPLAALPALPAAAGPSPPVRRVVIVGAGMAGLAAANALGNAGIEAVVLEARERIGGRLWTRDLGGIPVDLGGSWIHNPRGNPMTAFAQSAGIGQRPVDPPRQLASVHLYEEESGAGNVAQVVDAFSHYLGFERSAPGILAQLGPGASMRDAIEYYVTRFLRTPLPEQRRRVVHLLRFIEETFDSGDWATISLDQHVNAPTESYGGSEFGDFPDGGYRRLVQAMASRSEIRLGQAVERIVADRAGVSVYSRSAQGSTVFRGSHALVTVPLGVLKHGDLAFEPDLSARRRDAIARLGFGHFEKIALRFDEPFWERGPLPKSHFYFRSASPREPMEFPFFLDLQRTLGQPVLVGLTSAAFAEAFLRLGETAVRARVMQILREGYRVEVPEPTAVLTSSWGSDPYTRGAYSYLPLGATSADMDVLAEPHAGRVLFAGEATYAARYGYVDGALSSGLREVNRLLGIDNATVTPGPITS